MIDEELMNCSQQTLVEMVLQLEQQLRSSQIVIDKDAPLESRLQCLQKLSDRVDALESEAAKLKKSGLEEQRELLSLVEADFKQLITKLAHLDDGVKLEDGRVGTVTMVARKYATVSIEGRRYKVCLDSLWPNTAAELPKDIQQRIDNQTCARVVTNFLGRSCIEHL